MSRARSPETEIRYLRTYLRNARACLLVQADPAATAEFKASFARQQVRAIGALLAPQRRRPRR